MIYFIHFIVILLAVVHCGNKYSSDVPDISIPFFSIEIEKCNSGTSLFDNKPSSSSSYLEDCQQVTSDQFKECQQRAKETCQKVGECVKNQILEVLFFDQNKLKTRLEKAETGSDFENALKEAFDPDKMPEPTYVGNTCQNTESVEFQSFITTHRVRENQGSGE